MQFYASFEVEWPSALQIDFLAAEFIEGMGQ
jgi:hypothetical protein